MDSARILVLRDLLAATGWVERTRAFGRVLTRSTSEPGSLLLVGTPAEEPWHLAAHLDEESRLANLPSLAPTLVRWSAPPDAPAHLAVTMKRLEQARHGETVFVVAPQSAPAPLLERVSDARRTGATVLSLDNGDNELGSLAHERLSVMETEVLVPELGVSFDSVQHLVSMAAGEAAISPAASRERRGLRDRLARALDSLSGPAPSR